ncbi:hemimethylated DNA-binding domain protein [Ceratobasidium sp. AG-Ba]|nr:hemimethylated DNA-binding domain protein [Ceratobasidium sp. AG-Ba]
MSKKEEREVILGWDEICYAEEDQIIGAGVDSLPRGRGQPFCGVIGADRTLKYGAEDDMVQLPSLGSSSESEQKLNWDVVRTLLSTRFSPIERGFGRVEVDEERGRVWFVPAASMAEAYPEDTALGMEYMHGS